MVYNYFKLEIEEKKAGDFFMDSKKADEINIQNESEDKVKIKIKSGKVYEFNKGVKVLDLINDFGFEDLPKGPIMAVLINNRISSLNSKLEKDCKLEFIDSYSEIGMKVYSASLVFVLARAVADLYPEATVIIKHSLGDALYGEIKMDGQLKWDDIHLIEKKMREIIKANEPIQISKIPKSVAINLFKDNQYTNKKGLLSYLEGDMVHIATCGSYTDFCLHTLVPNAGYLKVFGLHYYLPGFLLLLPKRENPYVLPEYVEPYKLANVMHKTDRWADVLKVRDIVSLNKIISSGENEENLKRLVEMSEGYHEKEIIKIADRIAENMDRIRIVLIAGPSASGKTTFIERLAIQLRINGLNPVLISIDDYFLPRDSTPRNEKGEYDFESLDAIDRYLFNEHLAKIIQGEEIEIPRYNFKTGTREKSGKTLQLKGPDLVIMEGIHGLNDELTMSIPKSRKFKIYISALTHLTMDNLHRIHTTDVRLLRRMIRDVRTR